MPTALYGYDKVIMLAGGMGYAPQEDAKKETQLARRSCYSGVTQLPHRYGWRCRQLCRYGRVQ